MIHSGTHCPLGTAHTSYLHEQQSLNKNNFRIFTQILSIFLTTFCSDKEPFECPVAPYCDPEVLVRHDGVLVHHQLYRGVTSLIDILST